MSPSVTIILPDEAASAAPAVVAPPDGARVPRLETSSGAARIAVVLVASVALHALVSYGIDFVDSLRDGASATSEQEIPVEIVNEPPAAKEGEAGPPTREVSTLTGQSEQAAAQPSPAPTPQTPLKAQDPAPAQPTPKKPPEPAPAAAQPTPSPSLPQMPSPQRQATSAPALPPTPAPQGPNDRAAFVEPPKVARPDLPAQAQEPPPAAPALKPSKDEIEHLFLPGLFKIVAADEAPPATKEEGDSYKALVFERIIRQRQYPEGAKRRGVQGVAIVSLVIDRSGNLGGASLLRSTGDRELDLEAIAMVKRAAPFPAPPPGSVLNFTPMVEFGME